MQKKSCNAANLKILLQHHPNPKFYTFMLNIGSILNQSSYLSKLSSNLNLKKRNNKGTSSNPNSQILSFHQIDSNNNNWKGRFKIFDESLTYFRLRLSTPEFFAEKESFAAILSLARWYCWASDPFKSFVCLASSWDLYSCALSSMIEEGPTPSMARCFFGMIEDSVNHPSDSVTTLFFVSSSPPIFFFFFSLNLRNTELWISCSFILTG